MRNRAKCKKCQSIIESLLPDDTQVCECGEIGIWGGEIEYKSFAKDYSNFLRVDDSGEEHEVTYLGTPVEKNMGEETNSEKNLSQPTLGEMIDSVKAQIKAIENLPDAAKWQAVNQLDLLSVYYILLGFFQSSNLLK